MFHQIAHYTVSILFNAMLGSFFLANDDTLTYLKWKQKSWQEGRKLNSRTEQAKFENQREIGPWMMRGSGRRDIETNLCPIPVSDNLSVIDIISISGQCPHFIAPYLLFLAKSSIFLILTCRLEHIVNIHTLIAKHDNQIKSFVGFNKFSK